MMRGFLQPEQHSDETAASPRRGRRYLTPGQYLGLDARTQLRPGGLTIRLPVRAEHVTVEKRTMVAEEVVIRRDQVQAVERVSDAVRRERLEVETVGDAEPADRLHQDEWERR
jgi:hypothetical protein